MTGALVDTSLRSWCAWLIPFAGAGVPASRMVRGQRLPVCPLADGGSVRSVTQAVEGPPGSSVELVGWGAVATEPGSTSSTSLSSSWATTAWPTSRCDRIRIAAGQRNESAVQYHFDDLDGLLRALGERHGPGVQEIQNRIVAAQGTRPSLRKLVDALARPIAEYATRGPSEPRGSRSWLTSSPTRA